MSARARLRRLSPRSSLRTRLIFIFFATLCAGLVAAFLLFYWEALDTQRSLQERSLQEQAREILQGLRLDSAGVPVIVPDRRGNKVYSERNSGFAYAFFDRKGSLKAVSRSRAAAGALPLTQIPGADEQFGPVFFVGPSRTAALTVRVRDGDYFLVVSRDDPNPTVLADSLIEQDATPVLVFVPFILVSFALIALVTDRTLRPLQRASFEASRIGPASSVARVNPRGLPLEIIPLVTAFNGALDRLSRAYQLEKRLTADAAHELRTPLAVLRMRLEQSDFARKNPEAWDAVRHDFAQIDRLTGQLLDLARKEQGDTVRTERVNFSRVAREAAALMLPIVERAGRTLSVGAPEAVSVFNAAEDDLCDMTRNLIENALIHGAGAIAVAVEQQTEWNGTVAVLTVTDEGPGPPAALLATIFERFRKGDSATAGAGLGLAIVRHVAESHGGDAAFIDDQGCAVRVTLPLSSQPMSG